MKATGIVRKLDALGRVVLPIELRRDLCIENSDDMEISVNGNTIVLTKYVPRCIFCNSPEDLQNKLGKNICKNCISEM